MNNIHDVGYIHEMQIKCRFMSDFNFVIIINRNEIILYLVDTNI